MVIAQGITSALGGADQLAALPPSTLFAESAERQGIHRQRIKTVADHLAGGNDVHIAFLCVVYDFIADPRRRFLISKCHNNFDWR
jgi:hypothetical protein